MDFLFGSSPEPAKPFRMEGYEQQGDLLNRLFMGQMASQYPQFAAQPKSQPQAQQPTFGTQSSQYIRDANGGIIRNPNYNPQQTQVAQGYSDQSFISPYQQFGQGFDPLAQLSFQQRTPYQYTGSFDPNSDVQKNAAALVGDIFTPQIQAAQNVLQRVGTEQRRNISEDLNRRGLYQSGALTGALTEQRGREQESLGSLAAQLGAQQAQMGLNAAQFATQQDMMRQQAQAEELFRQSGASDAQAAQMAANAMQRRQSDMAMRAFQNQLYRMPQEDLFRLFQLSTGATGGTQGSQGLLQSVAGPLAGAAALALL